MTSSHVPQADHVRIVAPTGRPMGRRFRDRAAADRVRQRLPRSEAYGLCGYNATGKVVWEEAARA